MTASTTDPVATPQAGADDLASTDPGQHRVEAFIGALGDILDDGCSVLLTRGARNSACFAERRTVAWALRGATISSLHEGWLEATETARVCDWLRQRGPVQQGGCDGGPGSPVTVAWAADAGQVRVWVGGSLRLDHDGRWVRIWRGRCALVPRGELSGVRVALSRAWDRLVVFLEHSGHQRREVVSRPLWGASLDPTYDRADLLADCGWAVDLAVALGDTLAVDVVVAADLRQA